MSEWRDPKDWFNYEGRCFVCGRNLHRAWGGGVSDHLRAHVADGYLEADGNGRYRHVKPHEHGFPGIDVSLPFWVIPSREPQQRVP